MCGRSLCTLCIVALLCFENATAFLQVTAVKATAKSIARYKDINRDVEVSVYDDVLATELVEYVDIQARAGGLAHACIDRVNTSPRTATETAIEICLKALGDQSRYVEYWWREEWICLDAHRDIDELLARNEDNKSTNKEKMRFPTSAHGFYLDVGDDVCGPTILFHENIDDRCGSSLKSCTVVHAKKNRLVKMKGDTLHAVPRPELCYFNPDVGGSNTAIWTRIRREYAPQPERRSVLLFNTWDVAPYNVSLVPPDGSLRTAKEDRIINGTKIESWLHSNDQLQSLMIEDYTNSVEKTTRMKVGLLGDAIRRVRAERYLELQGDIRLLNAFSDKRGNVATYRLFES